MLPPRLHQSLWVLPLSAPSTATIISGSSECVRLRRWWSFTDLQVPVLVPNQCDQRRHDVACICLNFGSSGYAPLTPETEPNTERVLTAQRGPELLILTFSHISFTATSNKPHGTGLSDARDTFLVLRKCYAQENGSVSERSITPFGLNSRRTR